MSPAFAPQRNQQAERRDDQRHGEHVDELHLPAERLDVLFEARLGGAQFLADAELLFLEAFDFARLVVGQQRIAAFRLAGLQLAERGFGLLQLFLQLFFLGAQLCVGVTPQPVDPAEGPRVRGATANADEIVAAAQIVDGIPDELAVVGDAAPESRLETGIWAARPRHSDRCRPDSFPTLSRVRTRGHAVLAAGTT